MKSHAPGVNRRTPFDQEGFRLLPHGHADSEVTDFKCELHTYPPGIELLQQGDSPQEIFFIEQGLVKLVSINEKGHEIIICLRYPGWLIGASSAFVSQPYRASAVTLTRCRLRRIPAEDLIELAKTDALFSWQLHQAHSREILEQIDRVAELGAPSSVQRLKRLLRQLAVGVGLDQQRKNIKVPMPLKHSEVARFINVTPEHLSRLLAKMQSQGLIRREKGWIIVPDLEAL